MLLDGETCVDECAEGQFKVGVYCQPCDSTCKDCNTSATTCISCDAD